MKTCTQCGQEKPLDKFHLLTCKGNRCAKCRTYIQHNSLCKRVAAKQARNL